MSQTNQPAWAESVKQEARKQWGHNPAGDIGAGEAQLGTAESFMAVEEYRYREQPWMHDTFRFDRYRGREVLEIGVGLGTDHAQFARAGARLTGIDLTPRCIELTQRRFEIQGLQSRLVTMDAEDLGFPDDSFDAVYSFGVLHHTPDQQRAFREVRRVLRPGGMFLGGLYNKHSAFYARINVERLVVALRHPNRPRESMEERLSRIEYSTSDSKPLVRLCTGQGLKRELLQTGFSDVEITRRHLGLGQYTSTYARLDQVGGRAAGWYLVHHAR